MRTTACTKGEEAYVVSRYVDDLLFIGGYKFDLRLYVVTRFRWPLASRLGQRASRWPYALDAAQSGDLATTTRTS